MLDQRVLDIASSIAACGGHAVIVGGYVRDKLLGIESKDVDIEVFGLGLEDLKTLLGTYGTVIEVGRAFGVLRLKELDVDFSLPRRDSKVGAGHRGFDVQTDPGLDFEAAARRRDLTINSIGYDPLQGAYLDPHGGRADLARRVLRATDTAHFAEDPLRGMRVAQFAARLRMHADATLIELCRGLDLSEVAPERLFDELRKLLLKGTQPSLGLTFLRDSGLVGQFPELDALIGVAQDPAWHPEGDVWAHTLMVLDEAARARDGEADDLALMLAALCHDLGKPAATVDVRGRIRSPRHEALGEAATGDFLARLRTPGKLLRKVQVLVRYHLAPALFVKNSAGAKAYRRLARRLDAAGAGIALLHRVARADHLGRTTPEALARAFPAGDEFLERAARCLVENAAPKDLVGGRHLIERGMQPGPRFGEILALCRALQDEGEWDDPDALLDAALEALTARQ